MAPLVLRLPLFAVGASCLRFNATDEGAAEAALPPLPPPPDLPFMLTGRPVGKRHRSGQGLARSPTGRSYVYIAGVPGTGLDYWTGILRRCANAKICQPRETNFYTGLLLGEEEMVNEEWMKRSKQVPDRIVPMNLVSPDLDKQPDAAFFRAFGSNLTGFEDPRLPLYSKLAQTHGDSLKVLVLTRDSAAELLAYNMKKFKLSSKEADERLSEGIRELAAQVRDLSIDSYQCMSLEDTLNLSENLEPMVKLGDVRAKTFAMSLRLKTNKDKNGCGFVGTGLAAMYDCPHRSVSAPKTRAALNMLEELCDPEDFATTKSRHEASRKSGKKIQWLVD